MSRHAFSFSNLMIWTPSLGFVKRTRRRMLMWLGQITIRMYVDVYSQCFGHRSALWSEMSAALIWYKGLVSAVRFAGWISRRSLSRTELSICRSCIAFFHSICKNTYVKYFRWLLRAGIFMRFVQVLWVEYLRPLPASATTSLKK